jgi:hypothetical protein
MFKARNPHRVPPGLLVADAVHLGGTTVDAVYLGDTLVYTA